MGVRNVTAVADYRAAAIKPIEFTHYSSNNILPAMPMEFVSALLAHTRPMWLARGKVLFHKGDMGDGCYWLQAGTVKVTVSSGQCLDRILAILGPGAIIGELSVIDGLPRSATVEALTDCHLHLVSRSLFLECLRQEDGIYAKLAAALAGRLRQADDEVATASVLTVKARLARALLQLAEHLGEVNGPEFVTIHQTLRQNDLAAMAGTARESASRIIANWKRKQIVKELSPHRYAVNVLFLHVEARQVSS
jgi:CRP/FNR family transcriptional regulator, cyclic AMP receptor protein